MVMEQKVMQDDVGSLCRETEQQARQAAKWVAKEIRDVTKEVSGIRMELQEIHMENQRFFEEYHGEKEELKTSEYNR